MYKAYQAGVAKFDYFMLGMSTAVLAYEAQSYKPQRIAGFFSALEPLSFILLLAAVYYGLKRVQGIVAMDRFSYRRLDAGEKLDVLAKAPQGAARIAGQPIDREAEISRLTEQRNDAAKQIDKLTEATSRFYALRDATFMLGVSMLVLSKLLSPYAN